MTSAPATRPATTPPGVPEEGDEALGPGRDDSLGRLLALSDGVFAIALTLLALNLKIPALGAHPSEAALRHALAQQAPDYLAFLISFYVVASYWGRHRRLMRGVRTVDAVLVRLTVFLLLCVSALPFPSGLLGKYGSESITLIIYGSLNSVAVITMLLLHREVSRHHRPAGDPRGLEDGEVAQLAWTLLVFLLLLPAGIFLQGKGAYVLVLLVVARRVNGVWDRLRRLRRPRLRHR